MDEEASRPASEGLCRSVTKRQSMECNVCGDEIRVGQRRIPTSEGPVHEFCANDGPAAEPADTRRVDDSQARFRGLILMLVAAAVVYASVKYARQAVRRLLG